MGYVRKAAVEKITDEEMLKDVVLKKTHLIGYYVYRIESRSNDG
jgi:hypothetical protein